MSISDDRSINYNKYPLRQHNPKSKFQYARFFLNINQLRKNARETSKMRLSSLFSTRREDLSHRFGRNFCNRWRYSAFFFGGSHVLLAFQCKLLPCAQFHASRKLILCWCNFFFFFFLFSFLRFLLSWLWDLWVRGSFSDSISARNLCSRILMRRGIWARRKNKFWKKLLFEFHGQTLCLFFYI